MLDPLNVHILIETIPLNVFCMWRVIHIRPNAPNANKDYSMGVMQILQYVGRDLANSYCMTTSKCHRSGFMNISLGTIRVRSITPA
jgi:hypothetical protein